MLTKRERRALLAYSRWVVDGGSASSFAEEGWGFMFDLEVCEGDPCHCDHTAASLALDGTAVRR